MKLWRKMANKITVKVTNGFTTLTGRELKRYNQHLSSSQKPESNLKAGTAVPLIAILKRI